MPSFFIDTSVFISTIKEDDATYECERFMRRVRNGYFTGYISPYVAGEMMHSILYSEEIRPDRKHGDILHATCAKILNIPLVTIDGKLLRSQGLRGQGLEILHPASTIDDSRI